MKDDILDLAYRVSKITEEKIDLIDRVMRQASMLTINARIEAARAGAAGVAFAVVAQEMASLTNEIRRTSQELRGAIAQNIGLLEEAGSTITIDFRGTRYADLAHNAIEIIDRNLYERSCDVRWWATDSAVVGALTESGDAGRALASARLATILRSYTVYLDLWVADRDGRVVATGRPDCYPGAVGLDVSRTPWFTGAMATRSADDFVVADIQNAPALGDAPVAIYSAAVRAEGRTAGKALGALGIFFDWKPQAQAVVGNLGLSPDERRACRVLLVDAAHRVIAASDEAGLLRETYPLQDGGKTRGYYIRDGKLVAYARTPGYETYKGLGWYGVIEWCMAESGPVALRSGGRGRAVGATA